MILYSVFNQEQLDYLNKYSVYIADPSQAMFPEAYSWLIKQMNSKIGNPNNIKTPVWAWYKYKGKNRPDLRTSGFNERGSLAYLLEIEIPDNEVVLSDFDYWHCVLNNFPLSDDEKTFSQEEKEKTWENIFDLNFQLESDKEYCKENGIKFTGSDYVQATFWELKKEQVKSIKQFICR